MSVLPFRYLTPSIITTLISAMFTAVAYAGDFIPEQAGDLQDAKLVKDNKVQKDAKTPVSPTLEKSQKVEVKGNREYDARRFDTASKIVVTQEEIARYGDTEITDVLKRLPSVSVVNGAVRMRGLGSGYTQILLNGEPSPPGFSIESLSPDLIERIEIVRSASAEFSTQAVAGTINVILKKTVQLAQHLLKLGYYQRGQDPSGLYTSLQFSDKVDQLAYSVPLNVYMGHNQNSENTSQTRNLDAQGATIQLRRTASHDDSRSRSVSSAPRLIWTFDNEDVLSLNSFISVNSNTNLSRTNTMSEIGTVYPFIYEDYNTQNNSQNLSNNVNWVRKLGDSAKLELRLGTHYWHSKSWGNTFGRELNENPLFARHVDTENYNRGWSTSGKYSAPFIEDHVLSMGWEAASRWQSSDNLTRGTTAINTVVTPIDQREDVEFKVQRSALYAQDEWTLDKQLSFYVGARWEGITLNGRGTDLPSVRNKSSVLSPIFQTLYKIPDRPNQQIRFAFSRTYKAVNSWDLVHRHYYSTNNSPTAPDSLPNPNLKPELATGFDLGYEHFVDGGGVFSVNFFLRKINGITRNILSYQDNLWVLMPTNAGHATTRGVELEAKFPMRMWMEDAPALDFRANAGINRSSIDTVPGPNNRLDAQVPLRINLGLDYKHQELPLTLGGGFAFQNAGTVRSSESQWNYTTVSRSLESYALWKFDALSNVRLSASNLIRQTPSSRSTYLNSQGASIRDSRNPPKLNIRLNYEHRF